MLKVENFLQLIKIDNSEAILNIFGILRIESFLATGPPRQATGPPRSGAGVGMLRGAGDSFIWKYFFFL